ncbi:SIS domain-containing protein [Desulfovibrio sp. JC022]|uniref:D-sedoheptulose-7-phosphate isomerase n=1 Tax=Desulfovibrio sp. JC022 TaxID=2593642 RepID=UPI0013D69EB0|nr:D-sedoheptulose 7-phosphate isomerase [Desulfovibrio sp. JC022]NDV24912.1 D-sedoheptulose 7-phosphate isomerase [Desulfovibrio sp. JC022]
MLDPIERVKEMQKILESMAADTEWAEAVKVAASLCVSSLKAGGKVLFCGNGGSAADAQHLAAELTGRFLYDRPPLYGEALHCNTSALTAVGNDYGYDRVFERQIQAKGKAGDVLIGLSTSGNSGNVVKALEAARDQMMKTISLVGSRACLMAELADVCIAIPSDQTPRIQEGHILSGHTLCEIIEAEMFPRETV